MGYLALLILAIIFRGAIFAALGAIAAMMGALISLLSVGFWGLVVLVLLCLIVAAFA